MILLQELVSLGALMAVRSAITKTGTNSIEQEAELQKSNNRAHKMHTMHTINQTIDQRSNLTLGTPDMANVTSGDTDLICPSDMCKCSVSSAVCPDFTTKLSPKTVYLDIVCESTATVVFVFVFFCFFF